MENAIKFGEYFTEHTLAVFGFMKEDPGMEAVKKVLSYLLIHTPAIFMIQDIQQGLSLLKSKEEIEPGINVLIDYGYIRETGKPVYKGSGRSEASGYEVNPLTYK